MRFSVHLGRLARISAIAAITSAALVSAGALPALAARSPAVPVAPGAGYGPPPPAPVPGGYVRVVLSQRVCAAGAVLGPVRVGSQSATVSVPPGTFPSCVQVTLTDPNVAEIGNAGFSCYRAIGGVGVIVQRQGGRPYRTPFPKPLSVRLAGASISTSSLVVEWNGSRFVTVPATVTKGSASLQIDRSPAYLAVLAPACGARGPVPGATSAGTGKPLLGEGLLAGALVLSGAGGIGCARRRRWWSRTDSC